MVKINRSTSRAFENHLLLLIRLVISLLHSAAKYFNVMLYFQVDRSREVPVFVKGHMRSSGGIMSSTRVLCT